MRGLARGGWIGAMSRQCKAPIKRSGRRGKIDAMQWVTLSMVTGGRIREEKGTVVAVLIFFLLFDLFRAITPSFFLTTINLPWPKNLMAASMTFDNGSDGYRSHRHKKIYRFSHELLRKETQWPDERRKLKKHIKKKI